MSYRPIAADHPSRLQIWAGKQLNVLTAGFQAAFDFVQRRPRRSIAGFFVFFALSALGLAKLHFELTVFEINDPGFTSAGDLRRMHDEFEDSPNLNLVFLQDSGAPLEGGQLCAIRDWLDHQSRREDVSIEVFSPFSLRHPAYDRQSRKLTYQKIFLNSCGLEVQSTLQTLPGTPWKQLLTNSRGTDLSAVLALNSTANFTVGSQRYTGLDPHVTASVMQSLQTDLLSKDRKLKALALGGATTELHIHEIMKSDSVYQLLILLGLLFFFRIFYGTWKLGWTLVLSLLFSIVGTYATLAILGWPFDVLSNNLFIMLCVSGVEDFLFVCYFQSRKRPNSEISNRDSFVSSFREMIVPGFFTSFTTILGFLSLYSSKFALIGRFGLMSAWAALLEWAATFFLIPLLVTLLPRTWIWVKSAARPQTLKFETYRKIRSPHLALARTPRRTGIKFQLKRWQSIAGLAVAALLFCAGVKGFFHLNFEDAFAHAFPASHPHTQALKYLKKSRGWEDVFEITFAREVSEPEITAAVVAIEKMPNVVKVDHIGKQIAYLAADLPSEIHRLVEREVTASDLYKRYVSRQGTERIEVYVADSNGHQMAPLLDRVRALCAPTRCQPIGEAVVLEAYSKGIAKTLTESFAWSVLLVSLVILFLTWALRFNYGLRIVACAIWTPW